MNVTVRIPDDLARRLAADGVDLGRRALEALALEELRAGRMTKGELGRVLGFEALNDLDGFLKAHGVFEAYSPDELHGEVQALHRLGF